MNFPNIPKEIIFAGGLFATVTLLAYVLSGWVFKRDVDPRLKRLRGKRAPDEAPIRRGGKERLAPVVSSIGQAADNDFAYYYDYFDPNPQAFNVSTNPVRTKSRASNVSVP